MPTPPFVNAFQHKTTPLLISLLNPPPPLGVYLDPSTLLHSRIFTPYFPHSLFLNVCFILLLEHLKYCFGNSRSAFLLHFNLSHFYFKIPPCLNFAPPAFFSYVLESLLILARNLSTLTIFDKRSHYEM